MSYIKVENRKHKPKKQQNTVNSCYTEISDIYFDMLDHCSENAVDLLNDCEPNDFFKFVARNTPHKTPRKISYDDSSESDDEVE